MNLLSRYKKLFFVFGFIVVTVLMGWALYKTFFSNSLVLVPEINNTGTSGGGLPAAGEGVGQIVTSTGSGLIPENADNVNGSRNPLNSEQPKTGDPTNVALGGLTKVETITKSPGIGSTLSNSGGVQYYNKDDGLFYKIDKDGNAVKMSDRVFHEVSNVTWAPSKNKAILEYPDGSKIMYNFDTKKQVTYPKYWEDLSFSPQSNQIIAKSIGLDPDNRFLTVASDDGSRVINIEPIGLNADKVQADWSPNNQIIATYTKGLDFDRQEVFFVGLNGENFKSTIVEGRGLNYTWSTSGDRLLYSVYNTNSEMKPKLWIVDAQGDTINTNRRSLEINTWADKCTFATNTEIYCAVPTTMEPGAGVVREVTDKASDELYKIDLETGNKTLIAVPNGSFNVSNLMVSDKQDQLIFSDKNTGLLYKVKLK